ncbi:MAG: RNA-binding transcriptional accessory protein [Bacteroidetes bacterium GWC2_33_15]|nr:MAG: RNA-binding transcriptional accessory protein [Bacteroidetes bacterium GWA2_33_15]OFX52092.1 MAG: RNA-binding transcriptional accessory protein [Bacteroidetes bacterium GWC2_33_15]OFX64246.1 MAG: RNA-binding transcriptional accessory protein [Bacteroidetes bacterium GWB2_32_14]OFX67651.1 MAG: RNA-binding transcriptional accessory protein [Bacteroidetes bacterium GWD2_33_33]HAN19256.1 RNA-binding transcriptional accessory protein [Bacteroidales bacterium]
MNEKYVKKISALLSVNEWQVENTIKLLGEGATIPFISRYRKEVTGSLDEIQIEFIKDQIAKLKEMDNRRETILKTIDEQGLLTDDLKQKIENAQTITELEDIYLPYKPKKKTRATKAKERGLEPLAKLILKQQELNLPAKAEQYINDDVPTVEDALQGARDIIAEWVNENERSRNSIRRLFQHEATIQSKLVKGKDEEGIKYRDYFEWEEPLKRCPSHRLLAMYRGENEGFLKLTIEPDEDKAVEILEQQYVKGVYDVSEQVRMAVKDSYKRLLAPSMETEFKNSSKELADEEAIKVFAENLRQLLLAPPLGQKSVLAIDPGYRTGCKIVCLDEQGNLVHNETIYPHQPQNETAKSIKKIDTLIETYKIDAIAIGNGTASRETEALIKHIKFSRDIKVFVVSEDGASVYSASPVAREEFPQFDVTVRGSVSIGRRLMDPLAELVKIDPKSIGVGQYQHDVEQNKLKGKLDQVVESCVNNVGVNLNTASKHLLTYISGLGPQLAQNIVDYRKEHGAFKSRKDLQSVKRMGDKAFQQSAGFLRITEAQNPLDNSAVHPESYHVVEKMASDLQCQVIDLIQKEDLRKQIKIEKYITKEIGLPTLKDIMNELAKPGRDPRKGIKVFEFAEGIHKMEDLKEGMVLPGIVTNITNFGAFVDIGVKQDGLVHISQLANRFIKDPNEIVKLHQHVQVKVLEVDAARKRIQLSMKDI